MTQDRKRWEIKRSFIKTGRNLKKLRLLLSSAAAAAVERRLTWKQLRKIIVIKDPKNQRTKLIKEICDEEKIEGKMAEKEKIEWGKNAKNKKKVIERKFEKIKQNWMRKDIK